MTFHSGVTRLRSSMTGFCIKTGLRIKAGHVATLWQRLVLIPSYRPPSSP
jgi:hypothetical protein